ncbi:hypothetical protein AHiyo8_60920 [Arthrobacter sp. Hiyo8]|nr:hypothetical protein AHiyo8_60920 [Arthrobacter sp. Hiyo8]
MTRSCSSGTAASFERISASAAAIAAGAPACRMAAALLSAASTSGSQNWEMLKEPLQEKSLNM